MFRAKKAPPFLDVLRAVPLFTSWRSRKPELSMSSESKTSRAVMSFDDRKKRRGTVMSFDDRKKRQGV